MRLLRSSAFATVLLVTVMVYSAVATFVPQGVLDDPAVAAWVSDHAVPGAVTRLLGMHRAFSSPFFLFCVFLLTASAALCSWRRTEVARCRSRALRDAEHLGAEPLAVDAEVRIHHDPGLSASEVLVRATEALEDLGITTRVRNGVVVSVSPSWAVWGSPVFHWSLVGLTLAMVLAAQVRSDGLMGLAVGEVKPNTPSAYGFLESGPLHRWEPVRQQVRLDGLEPEYVVGGLDRGPTPTVSLLDATGAVIKSQPVYPNHPLKSGSLTVHADDYGLAVRVEILGAAGAVVEEGIQYVDFDTEDPAGTRSRGGILLRDDAGTEVARVRVTVPLDTEQGELVYWMPERPTARLAVTGPDGRALEDRTLTPGESLGLRDGRTLRVGAIDWYSRLSVVDDPLIPLVYVLLVSAALGLTLSLLARQLMLVVAHVETSTGPVLLMKVRLWRNVPCERDEIVERLAKAVGSTEGAASHDS